MTCEQSRCVCVCLSERVLRRSEESSIEVTGCVDVVQQDGSLVG
ncbi:hypothetical protein RSSM_01800 [Rhodopirellula sallentina SM41]|uniref:Uncharacterized protein n=1 Tax=Rhodopirellula sallentina SM41 TaxID=1263870 RepID=M5U5P2_9BACT|nr:hypothetical protein RSSM_01800 [Rhodopirellula sallentina SM41]